MDNRTIALLFSHAAGRCSMCKTPLFVENVKIGEMAHIIAKRRAGARGKVLFEGNLNSYENLILLCPNDHSLVDGNEKDYPVERLHEIKRQHETWVRSSLGDHSKRHVDVAGLHALMSFLPFTQLRSFVEFLPSTLYVEIFQASSAIEAFPYDNPQCRPFDDAELEDHYIKFVSGFQLLMDAISDISSDKHTYVHVDGREKSMAINPELSYAEKTELRENIDTAIASFLPSYMNFMDFLRRNYREVDITAYR